MSTHYNVWLGTKVPNRKTHKGYPVDVNPQVADQLVSEIERTLLQHKNFGNDYLRTCIRSKYLDPAPGSDAAREAAAIEKLLDCEQLNQRTNARLLNYWRTDFGFVTCYDLIDWAKRLIESIIGLSPPRPYPLGTHTNGASTDVRRNEFAAAVKYQEGRHITASAIPAFKEALYSDYGLDLLLSDKFGFDLLSGDFDVVDGNALFTVPKKSDINRCAAKEPSLNMMLQKGIGDYFRKRLRKVGVNLNDQTLNQRLAHKGSIDGSLATIDLSAASDSITIELVKLLLPHDWFEYLNSIRSRKTTITHNGVTFTHTSELFSTMGNGFTFELESLIFYAITRSLAYHTGTKGIISVYGDDIICPTGLAPMLERVFQFMGFRFNRDKSFWSGDFRESCGKHYFRGLDVSPFFLREPCKTLPALMRLLNQFRAWIEYTWADRAFFEIWKRYSDHVPKKLHGGNDLESSDYLVTPGLPRFKLVEITREKRRRDDFGPLLEWLHRREDIRLAEFNDELITSKKTVGSSQYRMRKVNPRGFSPTRKGELVARGVTWPDEVDTVNPIWDELLG